MDNVLAAQIKSSGFESQPGPFFVRFSFSIEVAMLVTCLFVSGWHFFGGVEGGGGVVRPSQPHPYNPNAFFSKQFLHLTYM